jgi:hypothetical protein
VERTATGPAAAVPTPPGAPLPDPPVTLDPPFTEVAGLLDAMPGPRVPATFPVPAPLAAPAAPSAPATFPAPAPSRRPRPLRLLPTPAATPFTFAYAAVLAVTSVVAALADPGLVHTLYQDSSTDVAHLLHSPVLVLVASALWVAGGIVSPYAAAFVLVLTALERRIGGLRAAGVFLAGHILATLATEVPVGLAVLAGHLPVSSLHRLDYGISFGVAASIGALAGLLTPWLRWPLLTLFAATLLDDLLAFQDPMTNWGHLIALTIGLTTWPLVRRWAQRPQRPQGTSIPPICGDPNVTPRSLTANSNPGT